MVVMVGSPQLSLALALHGKIATERSTLKFLRQQDAPEVRMACEPHAEEIKNFALEPVGARPDRTERVNDGMLGTYTGAQADSRAPRDG